MDEPQASGPSLVNGLGEFGPSVITLAIAVAGLFLVNWLLRFLEARAVSRLGPRGRRSFRNQLIMIGLTALAVLAVILALPSGEDRKNILQLVGILASGAIALASTSLLGNAMAGLMLRVLRNFTPGGVIRVGEHFGMVSERGLIHTEIQTEDGDLTTLPNLFLVSNPVTVLPKAGTVVSATVSLGYDVPRTLIEERLLEAAARTGLGESFVLAIDLGDFSVTWRVAGFLKDSTQVLSTRSELRKRILDVMSEKGIEIVSPTFMNTRPLTADDTTIPPLGSRFSGPWPAGAAAENVVWPKGQAAGDLERMRARLDTLEVEIRALEKERNPSSEDVGQRYLVYRIDELKQRKEALKAGIEAATEATAEGKEAPAPEPDSDE